MTRKDFELIAETIKTLPEFGTDPITEAQRETIAARFAVALDTTNTHFDRVRFIEACRR
jgi:hypothetical protein